MAKVTLDSLANLQNESSAVATINTNNARVSTAMENTLSRDGTAPNEMGASLDMNSNRIINLPAAVGDTEPIRKAEFDETFSDIISVEESVILAQQAAADAAEAQAAAEAIVAGGTAELDAAVAAAEAAQTAAEAAATALDNITEIQGLDFTLADAGADAIFGWDDSADAYENLTAAEATAILNTFAGDFGSGGTKGLVPAPATNDAPKFLRGDATWAEVEASGGATGFANRTALKAADTNDVQYAFLNEAGRTGSFVWRTGDYSAFVTKDTAEGLYIEADAVAATSGAWVRAYDSPVLASWFGADPVAADNSTALKAWLRMVVEYNLHGRLNAPYDVTSTVFISTPDNTDIRFHIDGTPGAGIFYTGSTQQERLLDLQFNDLYEGVVENITLDGNDACSLGVRVRSITSAPERIIVRNVNVVGIRIKTGSANNGGGISVQAASTAPGKYAEVTGCYINGVYKDSGISLAASGIGVIAFNNFKVDHNTILEVHHDGTNLVDCDGIVVFSPNTSSVYHRSTGSCSYNTITNALGRGIKLQVNGNVIVHGNTGHLTGSNVLISGYRFIDSQTGNSRLYNNMLYVDDQWTGGAESVFLQTQSPSTVTTDNERVTIECRNNSVWAKKAISRCVQVITANVDADVEFLFQGNRCYGNQDLIGTNSALMASTVFAVINMVDLTNGGLCRFRFIDNEVQCNSWITLAGAGVSGDLAADVYMEIRGNTMHPRSVAQPVFHSGSTWFTSDMLIAQNNIALLGSRVDAALDITKLRAGSSFYFGSTAPAVGAPALGATFKWCEKPTGTHIRFSDSDVILESADNGTAYKMIRRRFEMSASNEQRVHATDANTSHAPGSGSYLLLSGTLTAARTLTLTTTGAIEGMTNFKITRTGGGAFNWDIGGLKNLATNQWCEVAYNGSAYFLVSFGSL